MVLSPLEGPKSRGKNYFFGGTTAAAVEGPASIGTQMIPLPAAAASRKATLSGWLGNYVNSRAQVRAEFMDPAGTVLSTVRIGPVVTTGGTNMVFRSLSGAVPANTKQVMISVSFGPSRRGTTSQERKVSRLCCRDSRVEETTNLLLGRSVRTTPPS